MALHLFNPENDLALALGCRNYTPRPNASALHRAGALMPAWWADPADYILAPESLKADADWLEREYGVKARIWRGEEVSDFSPWGWSSDAVRQFESAGVAPELLPNQSAVDAMRRLSHRRSSIRLLDAIEWEGAHPVETSDPDEVIRLEADHPGCFIKTPWSGSGRGVFCASTLHTEALRRRAAGIVHRQGSVMVERGFDRVLDFAALFRADAGRVTFTGWSIFFTESMGTYCGNIVASQETLFEFLTRYVCGDILNRTVAELTAALERLIGVDYDGPMGIDMMVYRDASGVNRLHPCIELNLRRTMGVVAADIARVLSPARPMVLNWDHTDSRHSDNCRLLLPPREGFALCLTELNEKII